MKKANTPIRHSLISEGGIWEVFSSDMNQTGMDMVDYRTANLVYRILPPTEVEEVFVLKNRFGPTRYIGLFALQFAKSMAENWIKEKMVDDIKRQAISKPRKAKKA